MMMINLLIKEEVVILKPAVSAHCQTNYYYY